jgi:hypothetical protein
MLFSGFFSPEESYGQESGVTGAGVVQEHKFGFHSRGVKVTEHLKENKINTRFLKKKERYSHPMSQFPNTVILQLKDGEEQCKIERKGQEVSGQTL